MTDAEVAAVAAANSKSSTALVRYDTARKALAEARRVDEVKEVRDQAMAMRLYAKQAKDMELIGYATEIRMRAERCLGELMEEDRKAGKLARGGQPHQKQKSTGVPNTLVEKQPTLADQGIDKNLAKRARVLADLEQEDFETQVARAKLSACSAVDRAAKKEPPPREKKAVTNSAGEAMTTLSCQVPISLREALQDLADEDHRDLGPYIQLVLEQYVDARAGGCTRLA